MPETDILMIKTIILARGLSEALAMFSAACSQIACDLAPTYAHEANRIMSASVQLDGLSVEYEEVEILLG